MKFNIIKLTNPIWDEYVTSAYIYDFHHTSAYHQIECKENEEAFLFVAEEVKTEFIAFPLVIKPIVGTNYNDATSVYGYGGPIASDQMNKMKPELIEYFKTNFTEYCHTHNIISVFSRLHPLVNQHLILNDFGVIKELNKVVIIDLAESKEIQRQHYSKSNKNQINQLKKKKGFYSKLINSDDVDGIKEFLDIYNETMDRVNAKNFYYFDYEYYKKFLNNNSFKSHLLAVFKGDVMSAAGIFTETNMIMQYHLSGTRNEFIRDTPMKLLLDEARLLANKRNLKFLNLGGGVGGSDEDSLFKFKSSFSKSFKKFSVWNLIVNEEIYNELVMKKGVKEEEYPNFFPLYRAK